MTSRPEAVAAFQRAFHEAEAYCSSLTDEEFAYQPPDDPWSPPILITHLGTAIRFNKLMLQAARQGLAISPEQFEQLRDTTQNAKSDSRKQIFARLRADYQDFLDYISTLPEQEDVTEFTFHAPRGSRSITLLGCLTGLAAHTREHLQQLRTWLDQRHINVL